MSAERYITLLNKVLSQGRPVFAFFFSKCCMLDRETVNVIWKEVSFVQSGTKLNIYHTCGKYAITE